MGWSPKEERREECPSLQSVVTRVFPQHSLTTLTLWRVPTNPSLVTPSSLEKLVGCDAEPYRWLSRVVPSPMSQEYFCRCRCVLLNEMVRSVLFDVCTYRNVNRQTLSCPS